MDRWIFVVWQEWSGIDKLFRVLFYFVNVMGCDTKILEREKRIHFFKAGL